MRRQQGYPLDNYSTRLLKRVPLHGKIKNVAAASFPCPVCGVQLHLFFNGGELDRARHCGRIFYQRSRGYDLIIEREREA